MLLEKITAMVNLDSVTAILMISLKLSVASRRLVKESIRLSVGLDTQLLDQLSERFTLGAGMEMVNLVTEIMTQNFHLGY